MTPDEVSRWKIKPHDRDGVNQKPLKKIKIKKPVYLYRSVEFAMGVRKIFWLLEQRGDRELIEKYQWVKYAADRFLAWNDQKHILKKPSTLKRPLDFALDVWKILEELERKGGDRESLEWLSIIKMATDDFLEWEDRERAVNDLPRLDSSFVRGAM